MSNKYCLSCNKHWDCITPCKKVIDWTDLPKEDRIPHKEYEKQGLGILTTVANKNKLKEIDNGY